MLSGRVECKHPTCQHSFKSRDAMQQHFLASHSDQLQEKYACELCNRSFEKEEGLQDHTGFFHLTRSFFAYLSSMFLRCFYGIFVLKRTISSKMALNPRMHIVEKTALDKRRPVESLQRLTDCLMQLCQESAEVRKGLKINLERYDAVATSRWGASDLGESNHRHEFSASVEIAMEPHANAGQEAGGHDRAGDRGKQGAGDFLPCHIRRGARDLSQVIRQCHDSCEVIESRLCVIINRSKEALMDFKDFYCLKLVLDLHSPLASFFIALFSHLEFLLLQLLFILEHVGVQFDDFDVIRQDVHESLNILKPVTTTCRLLYATCSMLPCMIGAPAAHVGDQRADEEFKRQGQRQGRQFSSNLLHSRMQYMAYVSLDQPGCSRVKLVQKLGEGTSATVYKGIFELPPTDHFSHMMRPGNFVAVKMFSTEYSADHGINFAAPLVSSFGNQLFQNLQHMRNCDPICEEQDSVILAELEKLVVAKHPNIVTPMGYIGERTEGECGLVMELMDESLFDYLEKVLYGCIPPLEEVDMLDLMLEIARGMQFLHECELIHLDLKPRNVLLRFKDGQDRPSEVKIADLGLTTLSSLFQKKMNVCYKRGSMVPMGTSCYMAPELRHTSSHSAKCDDKVDVFSFGTTCFNILLGIPDVCAFAGSIKNFYDAIEGGRWQQWVQGHNPFLMKLIGRCWEMDPRMRPTFATLCALLQHAMETHLVANVAQKSPKSTMIPKLSGLEEHEDVKEPDHRQHSPTMPRFHKQCAHNPLDHDVVTRGVNAVQLSPKSSLIRESSGSEENKDVEEPDHLQLYAAISQFRKQYAHIALDLDVTTRGVEQFESHVRANVDVFSLDTLFHPCMEKLLNNHQLSDNPKNKKITAWTLKEWKSNSQKKDSSDNLEDLHVNCMMTDSLDGSDPLVFLKMQAYANLLTLRNDGSKWRVGDLSRFIHQMESRVGTDFSKDAAHAPIHVDTSLIALLISFWNIVPSN